MTESEIYDALSGVLNTFVAQYPDTIPVEYPDVHFDPPDVGLWLEVKFFPNETDNYGIGDDGGAVHKGFYQVTVCYRSGVGIVQALDMAGAVVEAFGKGTQAGPARVDRAPWIASVLQLDDRTVLPITIPYRGMV